MRERGCARLKRKSVLRKTFVSRPARAPNFIRRDEHIKTLGSPATWDESRIVLWAAVLRAAREPSTFVARDGCYGLETEARAAWTNARREVDTTRARFRRVARGNARVAIAASRGIVLGVRRLGDGGG